MSKETHSKEFKAELFKSITRLEDKVTELHRKTYMNEKYESNAPIYLLIAVGGILGSLSTIAFFYITQ